MLILWPGSEPPEASEIATKFFLPPWMPATPYFWRCASVPSQITEGGSMPKAPQAGT